MQRRTVALARHAAKSSIPQRKSDPTDMTSTEKSSHTARLSLALARREFLLASAATAGSAMFPSIMQAAISAPPITAQAAEPWSPHPKASPKTTRHAENFAIDANGTRACMGGWQWRYDGIVGGQTYEISTEADFAEISVPREMLNCIAIWGAPKPSTENPGVIWEFLLPSVAGPNRTRFARRLVAPAN